MGPCVGRCQCRRMAKPHKREEAPIGLGLGDHVLGAAAAGHQIIKRNAGSRCRNPEVRLYSDLPASVSPTKAEIALLRAFLADEIDAILRDGD